jgi:uncharacterized protein
MKALFTRLLCLGLMAAGPAWSQEGPQLNLPRVDLAAGMHRIDAQVAATPSSRTIGLMFRRDMAANEGMLFVFEQPATQCFWMKNTLQPQSLDSHCSAKPVRYVLEMHQGWFAKRGLKAGARLSGPPFTK